VGALIFIAVKQTIQRQDVIRVGQIKENQKERNKLLNIREVSVLGADMISVLRRWIFII
jgi:hypothetical protein